MRLDHNGKIHPFSTADWEDHWEGYPDQRPALEKFAREGTITTDDGTPLTGRTLQRVRERLLRTFDHLPYPETGRRRTPSAPRRFLIPGLWPWGTIPVLGGNYKAGKSTIVTDLTRVLLVRGYRFLDHFESVAAEMHLGEKEEGFNLDYSVLRGVVLINAETPPEDFERALDNGMTDQAWRLLGVDHLEDLGGAHFMDLTDPGIYDLWAHRLAYCESCDGSDDGTPFAVIVDGVTAILQAAGKGSDDFGLWYAAFKRLLHEIDVPNGLAVGHNTMSGGHLMGGTAASAGPDGLWTYSLDRIDNPTAVRRFSVQPRMGGVAVPPTPVVLNEEGRPVVHRKAEAEQAEAKPDDAEDLVTKIAHNTAAYVREHPGADGQQLTDYVDDGGWKENNLKGRAQAVELGLIREEQCKSGCSLCKKSHPRRSHYWPVATAN